MYTHPSKKSFTTITLQVVVIATILTVNINAFIKLHYLCTEASALLLLVTIFLSSWNILQYAVLIFLMGLATVFPSAIWKIPVLFMLIPFLISTLVILFIPRRNPSISSWFRKGDIDKLTWFLMATTSVIAASALIFWGFLSNNLGVGAQAMKGLNVYPSWLVLGLLIPSFAFINAFAEEAVYRGVTQQALSYILPERNLLVIMLQASAFAAAHVAYGFPNGKIGYLMTFSYGAVLGYIRFRTQGILASYLTHLTADLVIGYFLYLAIL